MKGRAGPKRLTETMAAVFSRAGSGNGSELIRNTCFSHPVCISDKVSCGEPLTSRGPGPSMASCWAPGSPGGCQKKADTKKRRKRVLTGKAL